LRALGLRDLLDDRLPGGRRVDRHVRQATHELGHAVEVVGMAVGDEDGQQRLVQGVEPGPEGLGVGDQQAGIDRHDPGGRLDQIRVDEEALLAGGVGEDGGVQHRRAKVRSWAPFDK
jgi:hypothetical protein